MVVDVVVVVDDDVVVVIDVVVVVVVLSLVGDLDIVKRKLVETEQELQNAR